MNCPECGAGLDEHIAREKEKELMAKRRKEEQFRNEFELRCKDPDDEIQRQVKKAKARAAIRTFLITMTLAVFFVVFLGKPNFLITTFILAAIFLLGGISVYKDDVRRRMADLLEEYKNQ